MKLLKLYFAFKGEINRTQFIIGSLITITVFCVLITAPLLYGWLAINKAHTMQDLTHVKLHLYQTITPYYPFIAIAIYITAIYVQVCLMSKRSRHIGIFPGWIFGIFIVLYGCSVFGFQSFALFTLAATYIFYAVVPPYSRKKLKH